MSEVNPDAFDERASKLTEEIGDLCDKLYAITQECGGAKNQIFTGGGLVVTIEKGTEDE